MGLFSSRNKEYVDYEEVNTNQLPVSSDNVTITENRENKNKNSLSQVHHHATGHIIREERNVTETSKIDHNEVIFSDRGSGLMTIGNTIYIGARTFFNISECLRYLFFPFKIMWAAARIAEIGAKKSPIVAGIYVIVAFVGFYWATNSTIEMTSGIYWEKKEIERLSLIKQARAMRTEIGLPVANYTGVSSPIELITAKVKEPVKAVQTKVAAIKPTSWLESVAAMKTYTANNNISAKNAARKFGMTVTDFCKMNSCYSSHIFHKGDIIYFYHAN